jgi:ABC-type polysaccharide/polyol phosphate export permease
MIRSLVIDLFCLHRKFLIYNLVQRNLKLKYRQSFLGLFWTLLIPAASALVYFAVFQYVMKVKIPHYLLFIMSGILPWSFFATALTSGMESIVGNHALVNKVPIPLHAFPLSEVLTGFINLLMGLPVLVLIFIFSGAPWSPSLALVPIYLTCLFFQGYGFSLILSVLYVFFRDLRHLLGIALQLWFYLTPILYTFEMIPPEARILLWLNPIASIFEGLHRALVYGGALDPFRLAACLVWTVVVFSAGITVSRLNRKYLVEGL